MPKPSGTTRSLKPLLASPLILLILLSFSVEASSVKLVVYGFPVYTGVKSLTGKLSGRGLAYKVYDVNVTEHRRRLLEAVDLLRVSGVPVIPPEICFTCFMKEGVTWEQLILEFDTPLLAVFREGELTSIAIALVDDASLDRILSVEPTGGVKIYTYYGEYFVEEEDVKSRLEQLLLGEERSIPLGLTVQVLTLAAADSVNPCTFLVFTALLLIALGSFGRRRTLLVGASFILSVLVGYYALGLGLVKVLIGIPYLKYIVGLLGLVLAVDNILRGLRKEFNPRTPKIIRRLIFWFTDRAYGDPLASSALGFTASFTLLPCSGGPYIVGLALISTLKEPLQSYLLLLAYNLVFVSPLIFILAAILASRRITGKLESLRTPTKVKIIPLTSGLILASICLYLILT